ncbi:unnamed protein product, partial [Rotaria sp. Silwood2]
MNKTSLFLLNAYFSKKKKLKTDIRIIQSQCQQLLHKYRRNLNILNQLIITLLSHLDNSLQINCRAVWCLNRNTTWWNDVVPHMTDKEFKSNFRLERSTYSDLLQQISPYLQKSNTKFRRSIPVNKMVCCALYLIGSSAELRAVSNLFGI